MHNVYINKVQKIEERVYIILILQKGLLPFIEEKLKILAKMRGVPNFVAMGFGRNDNLEKMEDNPLYRSLKKHNRKISK